MVNRPFFVNLQIDLALFSSAADIVGSSCEAVGGLSEMSIGWSGSWLSLLRILYQWVWRKVACDRTRLGGSELGCSADRRTNAWRLAETCFT